MPSKVTFTDGSTIVYSYAADGTKLRTVHTISGTSTQKDYCANVVYENGVQKLLLTEEGYVNLSDGKYYYYLKDHQGNNRVVVKEDSTVQETNHYYPFGGVFASTGNVQPYKYNGKELDTKKGLNWYDYGARHYDATLGRWFVVDPLAEKYYSTSAYGYCLNSPVKYTDPTGCTASTHTDSSGNAIAVYDDGDLGVYRHNADKSGTEQILADNYSSSNTSANGEKMGETEYWDEFGDQNGVIKNARVYFRTSWDSDIRRLNTKANNMPLYQVAIESIPKGIFDIKVKNEYAPSGVGTGRLLNGKYATARSAGNFLAGMNGATGTLAGKHISLKLYMRMAGALHWVTNNFSTTIEPPYYGETPYAGRMILAGFNYGRNK